MKKGGGGGQTTKTGLKFETEIQDELFNSLKKKGYIIEESNLGHDIYYNKIKIAQYFVKNKLYTFLKEKNIDHKKILSKKLIPDQVLHCIKKKTLFIIEIKHQEVAGSVDEKLQTCDFKKKQYQKLIKSLGMTVEYIYVLNDWFKKAIYKDVLEYIKSVECDYKFKEEFCLSIFLNYK